MPEAFHVTSFDRRYRQDGSPDEFNSQFGLLHVHNIGLQRADGSLLVAEVNRKPDSPPIGVGTTVEGDLTETRFGGWRLKLARAAPNGGGAAPDAQRETRIVRQHSQEMALRYLSLALRAGTVKAADYGVGLVLQLADRFDADVRAQRAQEPASAPVQPTPPVGPPTPLSGPPMASQAVPVAVPGSESPWPTDEDLPF